jgi:hypothetical protein
VAFELFVQMPWQPNAVGFNLEKKKTKVAFDKKAVRCTSRRNDNENTTCDFVVENPHKVRTKQFQTFCEKQRPRAEMPLGYVRAYELETW